MKNNQIYNCLKGLLKKKIYSYSQVLMWRAKTINFKEKQSTNGMKKFFRATIAAKYSSVRMSLKSTKTPIVKQMMNKPWMILVKKISRFYFPAPALQNWNITEQIRNLKSRHQNYS